jgi:hypothetical protein
MPLDLDLRRTDDVSVRCVLALVFTLFVALWLPAQSVGSGKCDRSLPVDGSAQTQEPAPHAADLGSRLIAGPAGSWQARPAHDARGLEVRMPGLDLVRDFASGKATWLRVPPSKPRLTLPLLI